MDPGFRDESPSATFMDPGSSESPPAGSPSATSQGGHGDGAKSDLVRKIEEVEDLLVILRDVGTEIDDKLAIEIDYKIARIVAVRDAAIKKSRGSKVWRYFIKHAATVVGCVLLYYTAIAFLGPYLAVLYFFRPRN